jgi:hypothetical protein
MSVDKSSDYFFFLFVFKILCILNHGEEEYGKARPEKKSMLGGIRKLHSILC